MNKTVFTPVGSMKNYLVGIVCEIENLIHNISEDGDDGITFEFEGVKITLDKNSNFEKVVENILSTEKNRLWCYDLTKIPTNDKPFLVVYYYDGFHYEVCTCKYLDEKLVLFDSKRNVISRYDGFDSLPIDCWMEIPEPFLKG